MTQLKSLRTCKQLRKMPANRLSRARSPDMVVDRACFRGEAAQAYEIKG
jgi:hypothetical protein